MVVKALLPWISVIQHAVPRKPDSGSASSVTHAHGQSLSSRGLQAVGEVGKVRLRAGTESQPPAETVTAKQAAC